MKRICVWAAALLLACHVQAQGNSQEFIVDGGFEGYPLNSHINASTDGVGSLTGAFKLIIKNASKGTSQIVDSDVQSGKQALKVQLDEIDFRYRFFAAYEMEKLAPAVYTISFWMKASKAGMDFRVDLLDKASADLIKVAQKTTTEWSKYEIKADLSGLSATALAITRLAIRFNCTSGGSPKKEPMTYYLDDVSVTGVVPDVVLFEPEPYLQSKTAESIRIHWKSAVGEEGIPTVEYGTTDLSNTTTGSIAPVGKIRWSGVKLEGLLPDTEYQYRCRIGENISPIHKFRTMPANDAAGRKIRFISFGDTHENSTASTVRKAAMVTLKKLYGEEIHNHIDFIASTGDNVKEWGEDLDDWENTFFTPNSLLSASLPYHMVAGNHDFEKNDTQHSYFFDLMNYDDLSDAAGDAKGKYFSQQVGNALFIYLNSNLQYMCNESNANSVYQENTQKQLDWLKSKLLSAESNKQIDMIFLFAHHGYRNEMWSEKGEESYNKAIKDRLYPVFDSSTKIQVFQFGHTHAGERGVLELNNNHSIILYQTGNSGSYPDYFGRYPKYENFSEIHRNYEDTGFSITEIDVDSKSFETKFYSVIQRRLIEGATSTSNVRSYTSDPKEMDSFKVIVSGAQQPAAPSISAVTTDPSGLINVITDQANNLQSAQYRVRSTDGTILQDTIVHYEDIFGVTGYFSEADNKIDLTRSYLPIDLRADQSLHDFTFSRPIEGSVVIEVRFRSFDLKWSDWTSYSPPTNIDNSLIGKNYHVDGNRLIIKADEAKVHTTQTNGIVTTYTVVGEKSIPLTKGMNIITIAETDQENLTVKVGI